MWPLALLADLLPPCGPPSALEPLTNECQSGGLWHFYCRHLPWQTQGFSQHESCKWTAAKVTTVPSAAKPLPRFLPSLLKVCSQKPEHPDWFNSLSELDVIKCVKNYSLFTEWCTLFTLHHFIWITEFWVLNLSMMYRPQRFPQCNVSHLMDAKKLQLCNTTLATEVSEISIYWTRERFQTQTKNLCKAGATYAKC